MKEIMLYYANCNKMINRNLTEIVKDRIDEPYELNLKGYFFTTLGAIFDHLFVTDMKASGGKVHGKNGAAERLGINPGTLRHKMRKLGIPYDYILPGL